MFPRNPTLSRMLAVLAGLLAIYLALAPPQLSCRCRPWEQCWPTLEAWSCLNASLNSHLVDLRPIAAVCQEPNLDQPACDIVRRMSDSGRWRAGQPGLSFQSSSFEQALTECPGALINTLWESGLGPNEACSLSSAQGQSCHQGRIPLYAAIVESAQEVQTAVKFAGKHNLRLVIRNTGHDGAGSSSGPNSFQIFTHLLNHIDYHENFRLTGSNTSVGPAVSVGAGVLFGDLYAHGGQNGFIITGGDSATVGAAGGFIQGGGVPGFLGHTWGLAADNVLEFEVVTASEGELVIANKDQHSDLFWALRGGGGGTFGIVMRVTMRTYPDHPAVKSTISISGDDQNPSFWYEDIAGLLTMLQLLNRQGIPGVLRLLQTSPGFLGAFVDVYFLNHTEVEDANDTIKAILRNDGGRYYISSVALDALSSDIGADVPAINELFGSVLVSNDLFHSESGPNLIAERMSQIGLRDGEWILTSNLGGQVNDKNRANIPLHPAWRSSAQLISLVVNVDTAPGARDRAMRRLTDELMPRLYALDPSQRVSYRNMGDPNEPEFKDVYWSAANYDRLAQIKRDWDPQDLFISRTGVGSERWDFEGFCRV